MATAKDLETLARLYGQVVGDGLVKRAGTLPVEQREQVLRPIRQRLARAEREAGALADTAAADAAAPLRQIAAVAQAGDQKLRALMEEATP